MPEEQPNEEVSEDYEIKSVLEGTFSLLDEYATKTNQTADKLLVRVYISREEDEEPYSLIINPAISGEDGKVEVLVINLLRRFNLISQFVANATWENGKPIFKRRQHISLVGENIFSPLEIATLSKEAIVQAIQKLNIEQSAKIFPFNPNISNSIS